MAAHTTRLTWAVLLALCYTPTLAASGERLARLVTAGDTGAAAGVEGGSEEAGAPGKVSRDCTASATHDDSVVFPGRSTGRSDAPHPTMASLPSRYPFWPPARHQDLIPEPREEVNDPRHQQRFPRHFPLVQARHQRNNPWRQARQLGYMARGQPQPSSSLWYWD